MIIARLSTLACALVLLQANLVLAQSSQSAGQPASVQKDREASKLIGVEIIGLSRVDEAAALKDTHLKAGDVAHPDDVTRDLRSLWQTGFFLDVSATLIDGSEGAVLRWRVREKPIIRQVDILGRSAVSEDDVKNVVTIKPYTILNRTVLQKTSEKIRELYVSRGYYLAQVDFTTHPSPGREGEVDVAFKIEERERVTVRAINFIGNKAIDSATLRAVMQTRVGHELSWLTQGGTYREEDVEVDLLRLQALYYDRGYVTVKVFPPRATLSHDRRFIYLTLRIEEGDAFDIGELDVSGSPDLPADSGLGLGPLSAEDVAQKLTLKQHERFSRSKLMQDVQVVTDLYRDRGFAYANVTPNTQVDPITEKVNIAFDVDPGEPVFFGRIEIVGNIRTRDRVIRRELAIFEGERFNAEALNLSRARIYQLGFFENVELVTHQGEQADTMVVSVEVKEKSTGTFQIGAGFSSLENFIAQAQISQNNFLGSGQALSLQAQLSFGAFARQLATLQFFEPYLLETPWSFGFNAYLQQRYYRDFQRNARGFGPTLGYPLTHDLRLSGGYTLEFVEITSQNAQQDAVLYNLNRDGRVSSVNGSLTYDTRDNRLMPSRGLFGEGRFELSSRYLGANAQMAFKRTELTFRLYQPIAYNVVFRMNLQLGWIFGSPGGSVPISERYFPGGIYSVRGFAPRGLGPTLRVMSDVSSPSATSREFVIGGNKQAIANFELEVPLIAQAGLKGVLFVDAGNAYNDDEGLLYLNTPKSRRAPGYLMASNRKVALPLGLFYSFGFGLRWLSPIGPLRFEWGIPITKHAAFDRDIVFEFTIGNFF